MGLSDAAFVSARDAADAIIWLTTVAVAALKNVRRSIRFPLEHVKRAVPTSFHHPPPNAKSMETRVLQCSRVAASVPSGMVPVYVTAPGSASGEGSTS